MKIYPQWARQRVRLTRPFSWRTCRLVHYGGKKASANRLYDQSYFFCWRNPVMRMAPSAEISMME